MDGKLEFGAFRQLFPGEAAHGCCHEFGDRAGEIFLEPGHLQPGPVQDRVEFRVDGAGGKDARQQTAGSSSTGPKGKRSDPGSGWGWVRGGMITCAGCEWQECSRRLARRSSSASFIRLFGYPSSSPSYVDEISSLVSSMPRPEASVIRASVTTVMVTGTAVPPRAENGRSHGHWRRA